MSLGVISPRELQDKVNAGQSVDLVDVRTPVEFREARVEYARNVPLDQLDPAAEAAAADGKTLYVICRTGNRARQAGEKLLAAGCDSVVNVEGGTRAWEESGLPLVRPEGSGPIALERQVRIAAGSLVLVGVVLGALVHPFWIGLSAFVGAGLLFAGITDTCGMGMLLARMPWNNRSCSSD